MLEFRIFTYSGSFLIIKESRAALRSSTLPMRLRNLFKSSLCSGYAM